MRSERNSRNKPGVWVVLGAVLAALIMLPVAGAQSFGLKNVQGRVLDGENAPINGAIVYLENTRNNNIKTFVSSNGGNFRFANLAADTDYTLWAAYHGKKSAQKTISSFDSRKQVNVDLKIK